MAVHACRVGNCGVSLVEVFKVKDGVFRKMMERAIDFVDDAKEACVDGERTRRLKYLNFPYHCKETESSRTLTSDFVVMCQSLEMNSKQYGCSHRDINMLVALNIKSPKSKPIFLPLKRESNRKVFRFLRLKHKLFIIAVDPKPLFYNYATQTASFRHFAILASLTL